MITDEIKQQIKSVLRELSIQAKEVHLEHPAVEEHGDYSSNVALATFEKAKGRRLKDEGKFKSPRKFAEMIAQELQKDIELKKIVEKIDVAGPGFINFHLMPSALISPLSEIQKQGNQFGSGSMIQDKKVMVEFTDPNPFKEFHIGHLFSNTVGESLCRLLESQGANVKRVNYQGDVGLHVAKALWGVMKMKSQLPKDAESFSAKAKFMGEAYAMGATAYEEDEKAKAEIIDINKKVYEKDSDTMKLYKKGRQWSLDYFETIYHRLGTAFDFYYFESVAGEVGLGLVKENLKKGIFKESDGATVFPGEEFGLHTRVFINSLGLPTYEAKELGLAPTKYKDFPYDESIIVTGNEINEYFRVLLAALKQVSPDLGNKTRHLSHGMVRVPTGKMSSRKGNVLTGEWLLDEAKRLILERMATSEHPIPSNERDDNADKIAVGAVKYALLKSGIGQNVVFDFDKSVAIDGNSGPYIQYTYARTKSVLAKAPKLKGQIDTYSPNSEELAILRWIYRFPEVVMEAARAYSPNLVCTFLHELSQRYNTFYNKHSILRPQDEIKSQKLKVKSEGSEDSIREFRLTLTAVVGQVLKNGLYLLGIQAPEKM